MENKILTAEEFRDMLYKVYNEKCSDLEKASRLLTFAEQEYNKLASTKKAKKS